MTEPEEPIRAPWPPANVEVLNVIQDPYIRPEERLRDEAQLEEE